MDEVEHEGNQSSSVEEVARVREVVADLLQEGVTWTDMKGKVWRLELRDTGGGAVQCAGGRFAGGAWR